MSRLVALALLLALVFPGVAWAEEREWAAEVPKGMDGGIVCRAEATSVGNTYRMTNYIGADPGQPADRERAWQVSYCDRIGREDVARAFFFIWDQTIDPSSVRVSWEPYR